MFDNLSNILPRYEGGIYFPIVEDWLNMVLLNHWESYRINRYLWGAYSGGGTWTWMLVVQIVNYYEDRLSQDEAEELRHVLGGYNDFLKSRQRMYKIDEAVSLIFTRVHFMFQEFEERSREPYTVGLRRSSRRTSGSERLTIDTFVGQGQSYEDSTNEGDIVEHRQMYQIIRNEFDDGTDEESSTNGEDNDDAGGSSTNE